MRSFSKYKERMVAKYYQQTNCIQGTMAKFNISYKEFYKIKINSRILSVRIFDGVVYKICTSCKTELVRDTNNFYRRNNGKYYYSSCKKCMKIMARNYTIMNRELIRDRNNRRSREYYERNKKIRLSYSREYYMKNRTVVLKRKSIIYKRLRNKFILSLFK